MEHGEQLRFERERMADVARAALESRRRGLPACWQWLQERPEYRELLAELEAEARAADITAA